VGRLSLPRSTCTESRGDSALLVLMAYSRVRLLVSFAAHSYWTCPSQCTGQKMGLKFMFLRNYVASHEICQGDYE
jgi:hypothetical protein